MRLAIPCFLLALGLGCYHKGDYEKKPSDVIQFAALPSNVPADGATLTTVTVNSPEARSAVPGNTTVQFTASQGRLIPTGTAIPLDSNGTASIQLQSPSIPEDSLLTASVTTGGNTYSIGTSLTFVPALPESLSLAPQKLSIHGKLSDSVVINLQAHRAVGTVTVGLPLTFTAVDASGAALGMFTTAHVYCDTNGSATTTYSAGDTSYRGTVTFRATVDGLAITGTATLQVID